jgi:hypothetical protein
MKSNVLVIAGSLLLAAFGLSKIGKYKKLYDNIHYTIGGKLHSIHTNKLVVRTDIALHNTTDSKFQLTKPYVIIYSGNEMTELGRSIKPDSIPYTLLPKSKVNIPPIFIEIPYSQAFLQLLGKFGLLVTNIIANQQKKQLGIRILVKAIFNIDNIKDVVQTKEINI